jgi:hypothetical protein
MISEEMMAQATQEYEQALLGALPETVPQHTFSKTFEKKMARLCRKTKHSSAYTAFKRVACAVILVVLLGSTAVLSSAEGHATVMGWINMISDRFTQKTEEPIAKNYDLKEVPEGYRLVERSQRRGGGFVLYVDQRGNFLVFDYQYDPDGGSYFMKMENHIHLQETVDGQVMDIYLSQDPAYRNAVVWSVPGEATFSLSAYMEKNDLIEMTRKVVATNK